MWYFFWFNQIKLNLNSQRWIEEIGCAIGVPLLQISVDQIGDFVFEFEFFCELRFDFRIYQDQPLKGAWELTNLLLYSCHL